MSPKPQRFTIGYIKRANGFNGALQLKLQKEVVLKRHDFIFISIDGHHIPFRIDDIKGSSNEPIIKLSFIENVEQVKYIIGSEVLTDKKSDKVQDSYAIIGYDLYDSQIGKIGRINDVLKMPGQWMLLVDYHGDEKMIPFIESWIEGIFPEYKEVAMALPIGILDL
jgi:ribosomal 30S subunit maturation factor RimM